VAVVQVVGIDAACKVARLEAGVPQIYYIGEIGERRKDACEEGLLSLGGRHGDVHGGGPSPPRVPSAVVAVFVTVRTSVNRST
jgi:hypothetical protein